MKSTIAYLKKPRTWNHSVAHYQAIRDNGFQYYTNDVEGIVVKLNNVWTSWEDAAKVVKGLPELVMTERD